MNPTSVSPRTTRPAESPPPRDPKAVGSSPGDEAVSSGRAFGTLVEEAAKESPAQGQNASQETAQDAGQDAGQEARQEARAGDLPLTEDKAAKDTAAAVNAADMMLPTEPRADLPPPLPPQHWTTRAPQPNPEGDGLLALKDTTATAAPKAAEPALPATAAQDAAELKPKTTGSTPSETFGALLGTAQEAAEPGSLNSVPQAALRTPEPPPAAPPPPPPSTAPPLPIVALPATIALKALEGMNRFDIRLDPEDLGRVEIALEIDGDGSIRAAIAADNPEALQLIVREARALEQAFDQAGFRRDDNALSFSLSDQQDPSRQQQDRTRNQPVMTRFFVDGEAEGPADLIAMPMAATGRLDVRI